MDTREGRDVYAALTDGQSVKQRTFHDQIIFDLDATMSTRKVAMTAALAFVAVLVAGCADASAQANVPDHLTFSTAAPGVLTAGAKAALAKLPQDMPDRQYGVVLSMTAQGTWYARVLVRGGVAVLYQGGRCFDDGHTYQDSDWWRQQVAPGDAIIWSPKRNDVCSSDLTVANAGDALGGGK